MLPICLHEYFNKNPKFSNFHFNRYKFSLYFWKMNYICTNCNCKAINYSDQICRRQFLPPLQRGNPKVYFGTWNLLNISLATRIALKVIKDSHNINDNILKEVRENKAA